MDPSRTDKNRFIQHNITVAGRRNRMQHPAVMPALACMHCGGDEHIRLFNQRILLVVHIILQTLQLFDVCSLVSANAYLLHMSRSLGNIILEACHALPDIPAEHPMRRPRRLNPAYNTIMPVIHKCLTDLPSHIYIHVLPPLTVMCYSSSSKYTLLSISHCHPPTHRSFPASPISLQAKPNVRPDKPQTLSRRLPRNYPAQQ